MSGCFIAKGMYDGVREEELTDLGVVTMATITHDITVTMNLSMNIPDGQTEDSYLRQQAYTNMSLRDWWGMASMETYRETLEAELEKVRKAGHAGQFLLLALYVQQSKHAGMPVAPVGNLENVPLLAYAFGLTDIDPLKNI